MAAGVSLAVSACTGGGDDDGAPGGGSGGAPGGGGRAGSKATGGSGRGGTSAAGTGGLSGAGGTAGLAGTGGAAGKSGAAGSAGKASAGSAGKSGAAGTAGKAGGGAAGSAGKAGSAGSSTACPGVDFGTVSPCESCTATSCCAEATACVGEQACRDCWNQKTPTGCASNALFTKLVACEQKSCTSACGACEFVSWTTPNTCTGCLDTSCCTTLAGCFGSTACRDCWNGKTTTGCASVPGYNEAMACRSGPCAGACTGGSNPCSGKPDGFYCGLASDSRVLTECKGGVAGATQTCANGCAASTNSCATSNGFAGTEQAGRLTAGMACEFFSAGTCGDCADSACCSAETTCFTNPECLALWNCHVPCKDDACVSACIDAHPNGLSGAQGVYACMESSCYSECGYSADDAYIRYVHAAPGAPGFDVCTRRKGAADWSNNYAVPLFGSFGDGNRFEYRSGASLFFVYDEGDYELRLVPAGSTNCLTPAPQYTGTFSFKPVRGHNYSFVVNWSPVEVAFIEDVPGSTAGVASFQLVNLITQVSTSMEVGRYQAGFTAFGTVSNNNFTQPITVAPFTQKIAFRRAGSGVGFIGSPSGEAIAAIAGSSHTAYLMGQSETGSPQAAMVVCDNDVFTPLVNTKTMSSGCHYTVPVY